MDSAALFHRYQSLAQYIGWTDDDPPRLVEAWPAVKARLSDLVDDFYAELQRRPETMRVVSGGAEQIARLQASLARWITQTMNGPYDEAYVLSRWRVGHKHVEIGLEQIYTSAAFSRLRGGMNQAVQSTWTGDAARLAVVLQAMNRRLDLDLTMIDDAYETEYAARHQRLDRLAAIGQVAAGVAHEIRNPLNVIRTSIYFLRNAKSIDDQKRSEHLSRIEKHVTVADSVITALANFARMSPPSRRATDLPKFIQEMLDDFERPPTIQAVVEIPGDLPAALVDAEQLRVVLRNLLRNAVDAMPNGGAISVQGMFRNGRLELSVADTGVGIPSEHLPRVMEPFFSTKSRGLGLGLALSRAIVERNGGRISVTSEPGRGSTFVLWLDAHDSPDATNSADTPDAHRPADRAEDSPV